MEPIFKNEHISKLNQIFEDFVLKSATDVEDKMNGKDEPKFITSCPQSPIIKIATLVTGKSDGELYADAFNELSSDYTVKSGNVNKASGTSLITITRKDEITYYHSGRSFVYHKKNNYLESVGSGIKITNLRHSDVDFTFKCLDLLKLDSLGCTYADLTDRTLKSMMA